MLEGIMLLYQVVFEKSNGKRTGVAGIVLPESEEKVLAIEKGDAIALPFGVVTWWYNKEDTKLVVLLMGDTSKAHKSGEFTNFFLTGSDRIFTGFTTEFESRAWDLDENVVKALVGKQPGNGIVQLHGNFKMPEPKKEHREEVGLGADLVWLDGSAMCPPGFSCDTALQVTYIIRGSGRLQVVVVDGHRVLETTVKAGNLLIVPRFFVVSKIAAPDGMEWFSIITTPK
ncbi:hypothetical protein SO802_018138 [Lithocarpus litseifolius]|uniref:Cupin type-1 domain-containing protein n=1 Tax=Lithocarpus litseifolius TaxID=425828 RepID=A0AAW2CPT3_9ROSI